MVHGLKTLGAILAISSLVLPATAMAEDRITLSPTPLPAVTTGTNYTECAGLSFGILVEYSRTVRNSPDGTVRDFSAAVYAVEGDEKTLLKGPTNLILNHFENVDKAGVACSAVSTGQVTLYVDGYPRVSDQYEGSISLILSQTGLVSHTTSTDD